MRIECMGVSEMMNVYDAWECIRVPIGESLCNAEVRWEGAY